MTRTANRTRPTGTMPGHAARFSLYIYVLLAGVLLAALCAPVMPAMAQVPDNRGLKLDPEDSVAPAYRDTLDRRDRQRLDAAREAGDSFIPLIQGRGRAPGESSHRYTGAETSPERVPPRSGLLPPKPAYEAYRRPRLVVPEPQDSAERGLSDLMNVLIETWSRPPEIVRLRYPPTPERLPADTDVDADRPEAPLLLLASIGPGRGLYAHTLHAVDSDYPGPVLLELLEPPLAGAVASGAFTLVGERLVLRLDRLEYRGRNISIDAWGVGLDCACYGVAGEVDRHFVERVLLPAAVRFAEGFLTALGRPAESLSVDGGVRYERLGSSTRDAVHTGLGTAARSAGEILLEGAPKRPTVRIPRDTELVVLFVRPPGAAPTITPAPASEKGGGDG